MDVLWHFVGWTDVTLVTLGNWAVRESTALVLAGAWVSVVGAGMAAPKAWPKAWESLGAVWGDFLASVKKWRDGIWAWVMRRPWPPTVVYLESAASVEIALGARVNAPAADWPRVEWERAEWLRREVVRLSETLNRVELRMGEERKTREAAVDELVERHDELTDEVARDRDVDSVWDAHGLPVIAAGIVVAAIGEAVAVVIPWAWVTLAAGVALVPLAHAMWRRALREAPGGVAQPHPERGAS